MTIGVPENNRALRQRLRTRLGWTGLGSVNATTWVTPRVDREPEACQGPRGAGAAAPAAGRSWRPPAGSATSARSPARPGISTPSRRRYEDFLDLVGRPRPRTDRQALVAQVRLVQEWRRFPLLDPALPRELLPPRWSGNRAAEVFRERHAAWAPRAQAAWAELSRRD